MERINGRAYYLKSYNQPFNSKPTHKNNSVSAHQNLNSSTQKTKQSLLRKVQKSGCEPSKMCRLQNDLRQTMSIEKRQLDVLKKALHEKLKRKRKWTVRMATEPNEQLLQATKYRVHQPVASVEEERLKPTDKYFNNLKNIWMAERLLMIKPSKQVSTDSLKDFYRQHQTYKSNISLIDNAKRRRSVIVKRGKARKEWW